MRRLLVFVLMILMFACEQEKDLTMNFVSDLKNQNSEKVLQKYFNNITDDKVKDFVKYYLVEFKEELKVVNEPNIILGNTPNLKDITIDYSGKGKIFTVLHEEKLMLFVIIENNKVISFFGQPEKKFSKIVQPFLIGVE